MNRFIDQVLETLLTEVSWTRSNVIDTLVFWVICILLGTGLGWLATTIL